MPRGVMGDALPRDRVPRPWPPTFENRAEAGLLLARRLRAAGDVVSADDPERTRLFAIPRGGVAVAASVARCLGTPLDLVVVRKIGHPAAPELGLGAISEDIGAPDARCGEPVFDDVVLGELGLTRADLADVVRRERAELARRIAVYRGALAAEKASRLDGVTAVVVDDGLATGVTARAALRAVRALRPSRAVLAVPVAAPQTVEAMMAEAGEVVTVVTPHRLHSVGEWYADFGQLTDPDVLMLLSSRDQA